MRPALDDNLLTGYLLGELSEAEQTQVEQQLFSDHESYERLQALKAEITDQYVRETLAPKLREVFARRFLTTEAGREDVLFANALNGALREGNTTWEPATRAESPVSWRRSVLMFSSSSPGWKTAAATAMVILFIGGGWLLIERQRLIERLETANRERDAAQSGARKGALLESEMDRLNSQNMELDEKLRQTRKDLDEMRQNLDRILRQSTPASALRAILSLALAPGARRGNDQVEELIVSPRARMVQLQLLLEPGVSKGPYRAEVRTKDGIRIYRQDRLRSRWTTNGKALLVNIPADRLKDGRYEVSLHGAKPTGETEILNDYEFNIIRRF